MNFPMRTEENLLLEMKDDCLKAVDEAIRLGSEETAVEYQTDDDSGTEDAPEPGEERPQQVSDSGKLP